jgi:hypothetical protein
VVLARHGPELLVGTALGSQGEVALRGLVPLLPPVYGEAEPWPVALLAMGGTVAVALRGRPLPLAWALWLVLVDPRKGTVAASLPLALGGGEALALLVAPFSRWRPAPGVAAALALLSLWSAARAVASPSWPLVKVRGEDVDVVVQLGEALPQIGHRPVVSMVGDLVAWNNRRRPLPGDGRGQARVSRFLYVEERLEGTDGSPSVADNYGRTDGQREGAS